MSNARFQHRVIDFVCHPARVAEDTAVVLGELEPDGWEVAAVHVGDDASHGVDVRRVTLVLKRPAEPAMPVFQPPPGAAVIR